MSRPSHVRDAIRGLFAQSDRHDWTADDVLSALVANRTPADFSSVCRGLAYLEREGSIRRVNLGDGKMHYEGRREHHDHVRCERCGQVAEVPGCAVHQAEAQVQLATGYSITGHSLVFSGICPACRGGAAR